MERHFVAVTPTGDRPRALTRLASWLGRQTVPFAAWVVVDDGLVASEAPPWATVLRLPPMAGCSLARNLAAGLRVALDLGAVAVAVVEDDDWYAPDYCARVRVALAEAERIGADLVGFGPARYYHLPARRWRVLAGGHASLAATAVRGAALARLLELADRPRASPYLDLELWTPPGLLRMPEPPLHVGLKGGPGRPGIGAGHRPAGQAWMDDPEGAQLAAWVGAADAAAILAGV